MPLRAAVLCWLMLAGALLDAAPLPDAYVWQRQWTPALRRALVDSRDLFGGVRVLVAQSGRGGQWVETQADPAAFDGDARERIAVIRYDGAGEPPDVEELAARLDGLLARWRAHGRPFAAVEIDYDCGTARLGDYAERLRELRTRLPAEVRLSLTALPAWLSAATLDDLLAAADEAVLQVHAVQDPQRGLFDPVLAERWTRAFAARSSKPFRIALPAYGSRVHFDARSRAVAVESEAVLEDAMGEGARELSADPRAVVSLLQRVDGTMPAHWRGVAWFRLPVAGDRRAWTLAALRAVIGGRVPEARLEVRLQPHLHGAVDIGIANRGGLMAPVPALRVGADCTAWDAARGWTARRENAVLLFEPKAGMDLAPGRTRAVGWVRCARAPEVGIEDRDTEQSR